MDFIALGFALSAAFHNPWLHGAALVVLLLCLPRLLGIVYIPHIQVGIIEKIWSSKGSLREGQESSKLTVGSLEVARERRRSE